MKNIDTIAPKVAKKAATVAPAPIAPAPAMTFAAKLAAKQAELAILESVSTIVLPTAMAISELVEKISNIKTPTTNTDEIAMETIEQYKSQVAETEMKIRKAIQEFNAATARKTTKQGEKHTRKPGLGKSLLNCILEAPGIERGALINNLSNAGFPVHSVHAAIHTATKNGQIFKEKTADGKISYTITDEGSKKLEK